MVLPEGIELSTSPLPKGRSNAKIVDFICGGSYRVIGLAGYVSSDFGTYCNAFRRSFSEALDLAHVDVGAGNAFRRCQRALDGGYVNRRHQGLD
jgi:hypothetical protein